jgi:hypothetical protein
MSQLQSAVQSFRFFDNQVHYTKSQVYMRNFDNMILIVL